MDNIIIKINGKIYQPNLNGDNNFEVIGKVVEQKADEKESNLKKFLRRIFKKRTWTLNMDNIELQVNEEIYQINLNGKNSIKIMGKLIKQTETTKNVDKKDTNPYHSLLFWITGLSVVYFVLAVLLNHFFDFGISPDSIVLVFVGILATFIVVSNYMQVQDIKKEFTNEVARLNDFNNRIERLRDDLNDFEAKLNDLNNKSYTTENNLRTYVDNHPFLKFDNRIEKTKQEFEKFNQDMEKTKQEFEKYSQDMKKLIQKINELNN
jgi:methyl-accepting chemotaxis protein